MYLLLLRFVISEMLIYGQQNVATAEFNRGQIYQAGAF